MEPAVKHTSMAACRFGLLVCLLFGLIFAGPNLAHVLAYDNTDPSTETRTLPVEVQTLLEGEAHKDYVVSYVLEPLQADAASLQIETANDQKGSFALSVPAQPGVYEYAITPHLKTAGFHWVDGDRRIVRLVVNEEHETGLKVFTETDSTHMKDLVWHIASDKEDQPASNPSPGNPNTTPDATPPQSGTDSSRNPTPSKAPFTAWISSIALWQWLLVAASLVMAACLISITCRQKHGSDHTIG